MQGDKNKITGFHLLKGSTFWKENSWMQETGEQNQTTEFWEKEQCFQHSSCKSAEFVHGITVMAC